MDDCLLVPAARIRPAGAGAGARPVRSVSSSGGLSMRWSSLPLPLRCGRGAGIVFLETRPGEDEGMVSRPRESDDRSDHRAGARASKSASPSARPDPASPLWGAGLNVGRAPADPGGKRGEGMIAECDGGGKEGGTPPTLEWNSCDIEAVEAGVKNASLARVEQLSSLVVDTRGRQKLRMLMRRRSSMNLKE